MTYIHMSDDIRNCFCYVLGFGDKTWQGTRD